jgi:hypothetical protein
MRVVLIGLAVQHRDVLIEQQRYAVQRYAATLPGARRQEMPVMKRLIRICLELHLAHPTHRFHRRRWMDVVEQRGCAGEAFVPNQLLRVNPAVRFLERDVPLPRDFSEGVVDRHS